MEKNKKTVKLTVENVAYDKFITSEPVKFLWRLVFNYVNIDGDKVDEKKLEWLNNLIDAFEALGEDTLRLYAENAAMAHIINQLSDKPTSIILEHSNQE